MKIFADVQFNNQPILMAAWPGMGNVGIIAMDYLRTKLNAKILAELDLSPYFIPDSIIVKNGVAKLPELPGAVFHYSENPDVIIFESNAQVGGRDGITLTNNILDFVKEFNVKEIFTAAAFAQTMSYRTPSEVLCASNSTERLNELATYNVVPMPDGYIAGLNGLLLGIAATRNINSCCFLGTIPSFASNLSYPKASLEIVKVFEKILVCSISYDDIKESISIIDRQLAAIEDRIKEYFPSAMKEDVEMPEMKDDEVPHYIMDKIEKMFEIVKKDKSSAGKLKKELDRWNLYELYENRFLDLFKDKDKDKEEE